MSNKIQISYQEIIKQEYKRCLTSPVYFMKKYVKIQHPMRGTIFFDLYKFQEETLQSFHDYKFNIILKSRQMGISTLVSAFVLWEMIFHKDKNILIISLKQEDAKDVITKIRFANENLPPWLKVKSVEDNRLSLKLENGSTVHGASTTKKSGVGKALSLLIIDEAALIDEADELWTSAQPTLSCLDKNELILTDNGLIRLEELINKDTKIGFNNAIFNVHDGDNIVEATSFYMSDKSDLYEIQMESGARLIATKNHPLMTKNGWKCVDELRENKDKLICKYNQQLFGKDINLSQFIPDIRKYSKIYNLTNDEICYLSGLWIAEGHFAKGTVGITNTDEEITSWLKKTGFKCSDDRHYYINSVWILELLKWIGCSGTSHFKKVPRMILSGSKQNQIQFLRGLFDGDGCSMKEKGIKLTSVSYELLSNVRCMLLNFGIYSYIRSVIWKSTKSTVIKDKSKIFYRYELYIGGFDAHNFYDIIGFNIKRKQDGRKYLSLKPIKRIYPDKKIIKELILESGMSIREFSRKHKCYYNRYLWYNGKGLSISSVKTLLDVSNKNSNNYQKLLLQYNIDTTECYDTIVSIKYIKNDFSYDIKVPGSEKFICNGYVNHNTGGNAIVLSCVTKETMIITNNGIQEIKDFTNENKIGGYEIDNYGVLGVDKIRFGNLFYNNGKQKTNIIKTKFSELECTENHKLWAYNSYETKYGWYKSSDLKVGDYISLQYNKHIWGNNDIISGFLPSVSSKIRSPLNFSTLTPELCYLFGLYISEGSVYKVVNDNGNLVGASLTITCRDNISWVFDKLNLTYCCHDKLHYTVSNKNLIELMEHIGFNVSYKANQKCIPPKLLKMSENNIKWLLKGIFDGDGCGTEKVVKLTSTSKKLICQVRMILSNLGILAGLYSETKEKCNGRNNKIKHNHDSHNLEICGRHALKYYNNVGFNLERKQKNALCYLKKNLNRACSRDIIPNSLYLVNLLIKSSGLSLTELKRQYGIFANSYYNFKTKHKSVNVSRDNVILLYTLFSTYLSPEIKTYWDNIINDDVVWCEISSITHSEAETFDFSLPNDNDDFWCHSIIYNGVIGHQTPRGVGNWFHRMWQGAEENNDGKLGKNGFHSIKLPWDLHPDRNEEWRRIEGEKQGSAKKAAQEYDCDFLSSGENVIDLNIVTWYKKNRQIDPVEVRGADHGLWIWQYPDYTRSYLVCADVARGDGADFSACHVIDIVSLDQCAEYKGSFGTKDFGNFLVSLSTEYNNAMLIIERENIGWAALQPAIDRNYPNLFYSSTEMKYVDVQRQLRNKYDSDERKIVPGFSTNMKTRPLVISHLEQYCREEFHNGAGIKIYSKRTLAELDTFIWKNGKAQSMEPYNDDLVMSLGIGLWVRDTALRLRQEGIDLTRSTLSNSDVSRSKLPAIYKSQSAELGHKSWQMKTGRSEFGKHGDEDLKWLLG